MRQHVWVFLFVLAPLACAKGGGSPAKQPDGSYHLVCSGPLSDCLQQTERLCREQGYTVTRARDARERLGHESGESQIEIRKSDAIVYCGDALPPAERPMIELRREPPAVAPPPAPPTRACVPGATQACVGPGGCSGGQSCAADGARFEACDCGATAPAAAPN